MKRRKSNGSLIVSFVFSKFSVFVIKNYIGLLNFVFFSFRAFVIKKYFSVFRVSVVKTPKMNEVNCG